MGYRYWIQAIVTAIAVAMLTGCGSSNTANGNLQPQDDVPFANFPQPPQELGRAVSYDAMFLNVDGANTELQLGEQNLTDEGLSARYAPDYALTGSGQQFSGLAFGIYRLAVSDYDGDEYIDFNWDGNPPALGSYWIGLADEDSKRWEWFVGSQRLDLSSELLNGFEPYIYPNGEMLVALVLLGDQERVLDSIQIGPPLAAPALPLDEITLPPGFRISLFAYPVNNARAMVWSDAGNLYVGSRGAGNVYAVTDDDNDMFGDTITTIASGYNQPVGVDMKDGDLYFSDVDEIWRMQDIDSNLASLPAPQLVSDAFPQEGFSHQWRFIKFGPDGKLYVPIGANCNKCDDGDPYTTINRINDDGTGFEIIARGVRNTVGFDWHPDTGELWFTDNGRDNLGPNSPPDELNCIPSGFVGVPDFGFPHWHGSDVPDPEHGDGHTADEFELPKQNLVAHCAALGMRFYDGEMFPEEYRGQVFIAEHGDWNNPDDQVGCKISLVKLDELGNATSYEDFAVGWQRDNGSRWGRPVDVEVLPDGSILISDDSAGAIYRVTYHGT